MPRAEVCPVNGSCLSTRTYPDPLPGVIEVINSCRSFQKDSTQMDMCTFLPIVTQIVVYYNPVCMLHTLFHGKYLGRNFYINS